MRSPAPLRISLRLVGLWSLPVVVLAAAPAEAQEPEARHVLLAEDFSNGLEAWRVQRLDRRSTVYTVVEVDGDLALKGASNGGASALLMSVDGSSSAGAQLRWRWRVMASLTDNAQETERGGDDYAARVFVLFGGPELDNDTRALAYAWAGRAPVGSRYANPYFPQVSTVVLQSGDDQAGRWVSEERDIFADYALSFGEPPPPLSAIALLVDTDDTGAAAMAWFDRIELVAANPR